MAGKPIAEASVDITARLDKLNGAISGLATSLVGRLGNIGKAAGAALSTGITLGATAGLAALAGALTGGGALAAISTGFASDAEEAASKFSYVFGYAADQTGKALDQFAKDAGRSRYELRAMSADIGALLRPLGMTADEVGKTSTQVTLLASDLASFFNATDAEALDALRAAIVGESEPMKRFGVIINEARIQQEAFAKGLAKTKDEITPLIKTQAIMSIIMRDTANAQGDAVRTSDGFANSLRRMQGFFKDLTTQIGLLFLPAATAITQALASVAEYLESGTEPFKAWGETIGEVTKNVLSHVGKLALAFQEFFSGKLNSLIESASGGAITSFSGLITETLSLLAVLTTDFEKTWELIKTGAALAFTQIGLSIVQTLNTAKSVAMGVFGGISSVIQDAFTGGRAILEAFGIDAVAIFEGLAAAVTANIKSIVDGFKLLGKIAAPTAASIVSALEGTEKAKENKGLKAFEKQRDEIRKARQSTIENADTAFKDVSKSFTAGFTKAFANASNKDDFLGRMTGRLQTQRDELAKNFLGQFGEMKAERDRRQAEAQAKKDAASPAGETPLQEWLKRNAPDPKQIGAMIRDLGGRVGASVAAAADGVGNAAAFIGGGEERQGKSAFVGIGDLSKQIQLGIMNQQNTPEVKAIGRAEKAIVGGLNALKGVTEQAVKKIGRAV